MLYTGESSIEVNTEVDSNDITEHPDDHSSKYKCTECGKCFQGKPQLTVHRRSHCGEKSFECTVCSKRFTSSTRLAKHSRIHSGQKPYKCHMCDKVFSVSSSLNTHMRVHMGDNRTSVHCVTKVSDNPVICSHINVMYTATEDLMTVVTVGSCLKLALNWSVMFIFTLVQSRTHVDTVQTVLHNLAISRHICWGHTMKVLGSHVIFVRRNLVRVLILRYIYVDMKVWSRVFAVNVQDVSLQQVNWDFISWGTRMSNIFPVVGVVNISNINAQL